MLEPLKRNLRPLTHFICKELLYDYQRGKLDKDRQVAVEKYLEQNPELKKDLDIYKTALFYTDNLALTKVTDSYISELKEVKPLRKKIFQKMKWSQLPDMTRWMIEGFVLSACVMLMGIVLPWDKISQMLPDFQLNRVTRTESKVQEPSNNITIVSAPTETEGNKSKTTATDNPVEKTDVATKVDPILKPDTNGASEKITSPTTAIPTAPVVAEVKKEVKPVPVIAVEKPKRVATTGFLYSMNMKMKYDSSALSLIKSKLIELGAVKAGQVGLGWRKLNPPGSYYHFSLPEKKYAELIKLLEQFSTLRSYKNVHPRVMPEGQVRVILWIEDIGNNKTKSDLLLQDNPTGDADQKNEDTTNKENVDVMDQEGQ